MENKDTPEIYTVDNEFDFSKIILTQPNGMQGGSYYTKIQINQNFFYLQTPKCSSKQGVIVTNGKKSYIDIIFSNEDTRFIEFMENLEKNCCEKIYEKKNLWFNNDIEMSDIENAFTSVLRPHKGGKNYILRANILPSKNLLNTQTCFVFDESENSLTLDAIKPEQQLIAILEIQGIKFTARSFQFEIVLKQILILSNKPIFQSCVIKKSINEIVQTNELKQHSVQLLNNNEIRNNEKEIIVKDNNEKPNNNINLDLEVISLDNSIENTDYNHLINENNNELLNTLEMNESLVLNNENTILKNNFDENEIINETLDVTNLIKINDIDEKNNKELLETNDLVEINLETSSLKEIDNTSIIKLKKPSDVYYEIYKLAKEKARLAKKMALDAYLEAKNIKNTYMLDDSETSDNESTISNDE